MRTSLKTSLSLVALALTFGLADATAIAAQKPSWTTAIVKLNSKTLPKNQGGASLPLLGYRNKRLKASNGGYYTGQVAFSYKIRASYMPRKTKISGGTNGISLKLSIAATGFHGTIEPLTWGRVPKAQSTSWLDKSFTASEASGNGNAVYFRQVEKNIWIVQTWAGVGGETTYVDYIVRVSNGFVGFSQQVAATWSGKKYAPNKVLVDIAEHMKGRIPAGVATSLASF